MTFLNPIVLVGLAAAAIPILIHLLNLRKLRTIEFSSLAFLHELQRSSIRRLKLRQLVLLALRTLLILSLVMAFARPALRGSMMGLPAGTASAAMVILLDDSPSMGLRNEQGTLFAQAQQAVRDILSQAGEDDRVMLLPLSELSTERPAEGPEAILTVLGERTVTGVSVPYRGAIERARSILRDAPETEREIYLLGDAQATQLQDDSTRLESDPRLAAYIMALRPLRTDNLAAGEPELRSRILAVGRPLEFTSELSNFGDTPVPSAMASLYLDSVRVAQQSATIQARGTQTVTLTGIARRAGAVEVSVRLEDDQLEIDNSRYAAVTVPERVAVLLAGDGTRLPELALTLGGDTSVAARFEVTRLEEARLPFAQFAAQDVVLLCDIARFSDAEAARLESYVRAGGGLVIFPGPATDLQNYNRVLLRTLGVPEATLTDLGSEDQSSFLSLSSIDLDHPLFAGMFEGERSGIPIESPRVTRLVAPLAGGHTIIGLAGGGAFLREYRLGEGRVMVFGVDAGGAWSDFPYRGIFAPLMHQMMLYLSVSRTATERHTTGTPLELSVHTQSSPGDVFVLRAPDGLEERLVPAGSSPTGTIRFNAGAPSRPGFHRLLRERSGAEEQLLTVAVNIPAGESDLRAASPEEVEAVLDRCGVPSDRIRWISGPATVRETIYEARFGVDLWKYFVLLAILCAVAEMIVGRDRSRAEDR
jgi:hypothetical protein